MINNIQESYCSFDVSKLLKEKGFDCLCDCHYSYGSGDVGKDPNDLVYVGGFLNEYGQNRRYRTSELSNWEEPYGNYTCPTHTLAIEWIRVNFNLHIYTDYNEIHKWWYCINNMDNNEREDESQFNSSQEATEAALLHTLKNLI